MCPAHGVSSISWTDNIGNLWLFGGQVYYNVGNGDIVNDLWRYDTGTGQWTWMSGSKSGFHTGVYGIKGMSDAANMPGDRIGSTGVVDSIGNLWLFGGLGSDASSGGYLNDLWIYELPPRCEDAGECPDDYLFCTGASICEADICAFADGPCGGEHPALR